MRGKPWTQAEELRMLGLYILDKLTTSEVADVLQRPANSVGERLHLYLGEELFPPAAKVPRIAYDLYERSKAFSSVRYESPKDPRMYNSVAARLARRIRSPRTATTRRNRLQAAIPELAGLLRSVDKRMDIDRFINTANGVAHARP